MSDLLQRLRAQAHSRLDEAHLTRPRREQDAGLFSKAADRIEALENDCRFVSGLQNRIATLEAALREIATRDYCQECAGYEIARRVLEGKP